MACTYGCNTGSLPLGTPVTFSNDGSLVSDGTAAGDKVYSYGTSSLRAGASPLSPRIGASLGDTAGTSPFAQPA